MEEAVTAIAICAMLFVALPAIIFNNVTQWRKAKGISIEDERLLDDLHETARRLDARLESIERIIAADNPGWRDGTLAAPRSADRDQAEPRLSLRR